MTGCFSWNYYGLAFSLVFFKIIGTPVNMYSRVRRNKKISKWMFFEVAISDALKVQQNIRPFGRISIILTLVRLKQWRVADSDEFTKKNILILQFWIECLWNGHCTNWLDIVATLSATFICVHHPWIISPWLASYIYYLNFIRSIRLGWVSDAFWLNTKQKVRASQAIVNR